MIAFLSISLLAAIWVLGLTIVTQEGMALYFVRKHYEQSSNCFSKPLITCIWCMPSIHSVFGYLFFYLMNGFNAHYLLYYPIVVCAASFIAGVLWGFKDLIYNESAYFGSRINYETESNDDPVFDISQNTQSEQISSESGNGEPLSVSGIMPYSTTSKYQANVDNTEKSNY